MHAKSFRKIFAGILAALILVSCMFFSATATSISGSNNAFGDWSGATFLSNDGYYITVTRSSKKSRLYVESEYQKYPSGTTYATQKNDSNSYNAYMAVLGLPKEKQSTIWSYHNWKSSSGSGMTKYTQLINA